MKTVFRLCHLAGLLVLAGCASSLQEVKKTTTTPLLTNGVPVLHNGSPLLVKEEVDMHSRLRTLWDAKNSAEKLKVASTKTGASIGMVNEDQNSSGSNVVSALQSLDSILSKIKSP